MKKFYSVFAIFICFSCIPESSFPTNYIIENQTNKMVELRFYDRSQQIEGKPVLVNTRIIDGMGIIYEESRDVGGPADSDSPDRIFKADSITILFDRKKIQSHYDSNPFDNSLTLINDYYASQNGRTTIYKYLITEENYNNALPCDGNCKG